MTRLFDRRLIHLLLAVSLVILFAPGSARSQVETGRIGGTITDPSGAVIPNAQVTVTNVATGAVRKVKSDSSGYYLASSLLPGRYTVAVQAPGFVKAVQSVTLTVGGAVNVRIRLAVATSAVTVEVTGTGPTLVNTETPTVSSTITSQDIQQLPSLTRDPYDFVTISGNISSDDPSGRGVGVAINGLRAASTNIQLDGAANNNEFDAEVGQPVPLDSVQEYTILTNNFGAQYGRASAGVVNVVTKGGTNHFHGSAYEYNRVSALASNDFYNNANGIDKGIYTRNQFGFSLGGPIKKNKLFFFVNPEWNRVRSQAPQVFMIPDQAFINASSSSTQAFFNTYGAKRSDLNTLAVYSRQDLINQGADPCEKDAAAGPCASYSLTAPMWDKVTYNTPADAGGGSPTNQLMVDSRVDWNISDRSQMYIRFAQDHNGFFNGTLNTSPYAGYETGETISNQNALVSFTQTLSPTVVSQTKIVFNRLSDLQPLGKAPAGPTLYLANSGGIPIGGYTAILPGYSGTTPGNAIPFGGPQNYYEVYEDMSMAHGTHTFRFGGTYTYLIDNRAFGAYEEAVEALSSGGTNALDNFMTGNLYLFQAAIDPQGKFPCINGVQTPDCTVTLPVGPPNFTRSNRYNSWGMYFNDEWKVRPRVTLTLGLRWDYFGVQHNKNPNLDSNFYLGSGSNFYQQFRNGTIQIADKSSVGGLWAPDYKDFSPHVGFAWDIFGNGKSSLRAGYSIGYERNFGNVTFNVIQNPPNYAVVTLQTPNAGLITTSNVGPLAGTTGTVPLPTASFRNVNPHIKTAYAHLYSLTFEQQLAPHALLSIGYSGSRGERQYSVSDFNRPGYGNIYLNDPCTAVSQVDPYNNQTYTLPAYPCYNYATFADGSTNGFFMSKDQLTRLNDQYSYYSFRRMSDGVSLYNSLNVGLKLQNFRSTGLTLEANYTYGNAKDDISSTFFESNYDYTPGYLNSFNPGLDYGPAKFDNRNRFSFGAVWNIPFARNFHGAAGKALDGWEVAPIFAVSSGFPFSIFDCTNAYETCPRAMKMAGTAGIPQNGKEVPVAKLPDTFTWIPYYTSSGSPLFDSSYVNPTTGVSDYGPFPSNMYTRDSFRAPGKYSLDVGIYKNFKLNERYALQFRAEMYNAFNHASSTIIPYINEVESAGGVLTNRFGHRNVQLAIRLTF